MELYKLLIKNQCKPPTSITSYENKFQRFDWLKIYMLPRCIHESIHLLVFFNSKFCTSFFLTSLHCNGSSNMIYLKYLKENKRFMDIGPTMAKFDYFYY